MIPFDHKSQHIIIISGTLAILAIAKILSTNFLCELFRQNFRYQYCCIVQ